MLKSSAFQHYLSKLASSSSSNHSIFSHYAGKGGLWNTEHIPQYRTRAVHKTWYASYGQAQSGLAHGSVWESCTISSDWCNSVIWNSTLTELEMSIHIQRVGEDTSILSLAAITFQGLMEVKNPTLYLRCWTIKVFIIFYYHILNHQASDWCFIEVSEKCTGTSE